MATTRFKPKLNHDAFQSKDEPTPETTVGGETMEVTMTANELPPVIRDIESDGKNPAPVLAQLGHIKGYEANLLRGHLADAHQWIDGAAANAEKSHPDLAGWLRKLKADL